MLLICKNIKCEKIFRSLKSSRKFCCKKCSIEDRKKDPIYLEKLRKKKNPIEKSESHCKYCGQTFFGPIDKKYCSVDCSNKDRLLGKGYLKEINCPQCNKLFKPNRSSRIYCSIACSTMNKKDNTSFLELLSKGCKKRSEDVKYIEKLSTAAKKRWNDPNFIAQMNEIFSSDEWIDKSLHSYNFKEYVLPSGKIEHVQGYEGRAIDILLETYTEDDLIINNKEIKSLIGQIEYLTSDGRTHFYVPDIYIKSLNKIIEVKSNWTYEINKEINELKKKACLDRGVDFEFMIL